MADEFDVNAYWLRRGHGYAREALPEDYHHLQEQFLLRVLREGTLPLHRILELGCGFGRITRLLSANFPQASILGLDLSPEQLENARQYCAGHPNITFSRYDLYSGSAFPEPGPWDAVLAVEVFMHHPASLLRQLVPRLAQVAGFIANIDWSEPWSSPTPEHVWVHDYADLYRQAGLRCATFVLPGKVQGLQQCLFIAGRQLTGEIIELERRLRCDSSNPREHPPVPPPVIDWLQRLERAAAALRQTLPEGPAVILVNDDQWGCEARVLPGLRVLPFLERDGQYWGAPADDAEALRELRRMEQAGAQYLAVAAGSFWWLEHYPQFRDHLLQRCQCLLSTPDIIIFKL